MTTTSIARRSRLDPETGAIPDVDEARRVHDDLRRLIGRAMNPYRPPQTSDALLELLLGVLRQAESDGVILSDDDYVELIQVIASTELAFKVGSRISSWMSGLLDPPEQGSQWSTGMATLRHYVVQREHV